MKFNKIGKKIRKGSKTVAKQSIRKGYKAGEITTKGVKKAAKVVKKEVKVIGKKIKTFADLKTHNVPKKHMTKVEEIHKLQNELIEKLPEGLVDFEKTPVAASTEHLADPDTDLDVVIGMLRNLNDIIDGKITEEQEEQKEQ